MTDTFFTKYHYSIIDNTETGVEVHECPHCNGLFGVDWTYLDQISEEVNCPMCNNRVICAMDERFEEQDIPSTMEDLTVAISRYEAYGTGVDNMRKYAIDLLSALEQIFGEVQ